MSEELDTRRLKPEDVEDITGISGGVRAQVNRLRKMGIHAHVNDNQEVICFWAWVDAAALPDDLLAQYIQPLAANEDESDQAIGLNFGIMK